MKEKYVRSFYHHPRFGKCLPLADNDPLLYKQGPVLVVDAKNRKQRMLFTCLRDWEAVFLYLGKETYTNKHKDKKAIFKRDSYKIAYYEWKPDPNLEKETLKHNYPVVK